MVIDKVIFRNWIGFWHGMDTDTLEIDFTKRKHRVCLIVGTNGSGKTALEEGLTLFPNIYSSVRDSNDFIRIDENGNKEGSREIYFHNSKDTFVSKVYWINEKTKCYLFRTTGGIEEDLNPSGNVTSYNEQLELRFGLTKDLDHLLFLGAGLRDIVSMTPSERKNQISKFTPSIEKYLELHKMSGKYYTKLKNDISVVTSELHRLGDDKGKIESLRDALKVKYDKTLESLQFLKHVETTTTQTIGMLTVNGTPIIDLYDSKVKKNNLLCEELTTKNNEFKSLCQKYGLTTGLKDEEYAAALGSTHDDFMKLKFKVDNFQQRQRELVETKTNLQNTLDTKRSIYDRYVKENDPQKFLDEQRGLNDELIKVQSTLDEFKDIPGLGDRNAILFNKDDATKYLIFVDNLMSKIEMLGQLYSEGKILENWLNDNPESNPEYRLNDLREFISQKSSELEDLKSKLSSCNADTEIADLLKNVPEDCTNEKCPFVKRAKLFIDTNSKKTDIVSKIGKLTEELNAAESERSSIDDIINRTIQFQQEIRQLSNFINGYSDLISKFPDFEIVSNPKEIFRWTAFILPRARKYSEYSYAVERYDEIISRVSELSDQIQKTSNYQNEVQSQKSEIERLEKSVQKVQADLQQLYNENQAVSAQESMYQAKLSDLQRILDCRRFLVDGLKRYSEIRQEIKKLRKHYIASRFFTDRLSELREKISRTSVELKQYETELNTAEYNLRRYDEFIIQRDKLTKEYELLDVLRKCWSSTTGVPLIFIKGFMNQLLQDANKYLAEIFADKYFLISGFDIDEKNFYILIDRGEENHISKDASQCSTAERAMLCTVLSLALLKQLPHVEDMFNITKFDEIDGALDYDKRRVFIGILTDLLDDIHGEQAFFISHSDTFQSDVDVILLKGSEDYERRLLNGNYNVIYRY